MILGLVVAIFSTAFILGCDQDESGLALDGNGCPIENPWFDEPKCNTEGLRCEYGSDCTAEWDYMCIDGVWKLVRHSEPAFYCFDAGVDGD